MNNMLLSFSKTYLCTGKNMKHHSIHKKHCLKVICAIILILTNQEERLVSYSPQKVTNVLRITLATYVYKVCMFVCIFE